MKESILKRVNRFSEVRNVGTETSIIYRVRKEDPGRRLYAASEAAVGPSTQRIDLEKTLWPL